MYVCIILILIIIIIIIMIIIIIIVRIINCCYYYYSLELPSQTEKAQEPTRRTPIVDEGKSSKTKPGRRYQVRQILDTFFDNKLQETPKTILK